MSIAKQTLNFIVLVMVCLMTKESESKMNCTGVGPIFRCIATDRDGADKFQGKITNIHSTEVTLDIMSVVDTCENINRRPSFRNRTESANRARENRARSTALIRQRDRDIKISKGGSKVFNMERVKASGYCSKSIIKACRGDDYVQASCSRLISLS